MNMIVLIVAGVFVAAGLVLIVLSFLVGRSSDAKDPADAGAEAAGTTPDATPGANEADSRAFIDEPLATDLAEQLKGRKKPPTSLDVAAGAAAVEGAGVSNPPGASAGEVEPSPAGTQTSAPDTAPQGRREGDPVPLAAVSQVGFNFRVQLGFKFLKNGLYQDGVAEFHKALSLTDDPEAKLRLYIEIGNAFRSQRMFGPAGAAYMQASSYTENEMLLEHLERTMAEMMDTDTVGAADDASRSVKEE